MIKKTLPIILIVSVLFSYEIHLDTPSKLQRKALKPEQKITLVRDDSKEIVVDKGTGLMWQDNIDTKTLRKSRYDAKQYCRRLVFANYKDWYLPRIKELESIVDKKNTPAIKNGFKNVVPDHYWSSSPNLSDIVTALNVDFKSGETYKNTKKGKGYIRCVRGKYNTLI